MQRIESLTSEKYNPAAAAAAAPSGIFPKRGHTDLGTSRIANSTVQKTGYWSTGWFSSVKTWVIVETPDMA
jgi:hypothetical protein